MGEKPLLEARSLTVTIGNCLVCKELSFFLYPNQCWGVLGINGAGKTTLLHTLAGLYPAQKGEILLEGGSRAALGRQTWARRLGVVFQENVDPFPATVLEVTLMGRYPHQGWLGWQTADDYTQAGNALAAVGLSGQEQRNTTTLSGGEYQRLRIATFLAQDPAVGLLDEPTNHLDPPYQTRILSYLVEYICRRKAGALLMVLHDVNLAARFCDHCLLLFGDGQIDAGPTEKILTAHNLYRLYHYPIAEVVAPWGKGWLPA
jgi:iron complex transport system ATP-binding protein